MSNKNDPHFGQHISFLEKRGITVFPVKVGRKFRLDVKEQLQTKVNIKKGKKLYEPGTELNQNWKSYLDFLARKIKNKQTENKF